MIITEASHCATNLSPKPGRTTNAIAASPLGKVAVNLAHFLDPGSEGASLCPPAERKKWVTLKGGLQFLLYYIIIILLAIVFKIIFSLLKKPDKNKKAQRAETGWARSWLTWIRQQQFS
jgi:hypothetical protein